MSDLNLAAPAPLRPVPAHVVQVADVPAGSPGASTTNATSTSSRRPLDESAMYGTTTMTAAAAAAGATPLSPKRARLNAPVSRKASNAFVSAKAVDLAAAHNELYTILRSISVPPEETESDELVGPENMDRELLVCTPPARAFNTLPLQRRPSLSVAGMSPYTAGLNELPMTPSSKPLSDWEPLSSTPPSSMLMQLMRFAASLTPEEAAAIKVTGGRRPSIPFVMTPQEVAAAERIIGRRTSIPLLTDEVSSPFGISSNGNSSGRILSRRPSVPSTLSSSKTLL